MGKHNFIPLCTFRGWSITERKWVYGTFDFIENDFSWIIEKGSRTCHNIEKDSTGVYIGKDDKNSQPIFCGCNGAKYGSDRLSNPSWSISPFSDTMIVRFIENSFFFWNENFSYDANDSFEVISNQYEEYLKEQEDG